MVEEGTEAAWEVLGVEEGVGVEDSGVEDLVVEEAEEGEEVIAGGEEEEEVSQ